MGLFDRAINALNRAEDVKTDIEYGIFRDRRFDRAEKLAAEGVTTEAVIKGNSAVFLVAGSGGADASRRPAAPRP